MENTDLKRALFVRIDRSSHGSERYVNLSALHVEDGGAAEWHQLPDGIRTSRFRLSAQGSLTGTGADPHRACWYGWRLGFRTDYNDTVDADYARKHIAPCTRIKRAVEKAMPQMGATWEREAHTVLGLAADALKVGAVIIKSDDAKGPMLQRFNHHAQCWAELYKACYDALRWTEGK